MRSSQLILLAILLIAYGELSAQRSHREVLLLMGSRFELTAIAEDTAQAKAAVAAGIAEIRRIEALISSWQPTSETSAVNRAAGVQPVKVSLELYLLISRAMKISRLSNGAFDISFAAIDRIWTFDGRTYTMPDPDSVLASVANIGYQHILLDRADTTVYLARPGMKIGFGAIGKGYAANRARNVMREMGIEAGLVNAGGDLISWGAPPGQPAWTINIADPKDAARSLGRLQTNEMAVVTSGDYERYCLIDGERYAHIVDPRTGMPVKGVQSVTIVCPDAELADALATTVFVMGVTDGIAFIDRLRGVECLVVDDKGEVFHSKQLQLQRGSAERP